MMIKPMIKSIARLVASALIAASTVAAAQTHVTYFHNDHLGSPIFLSNDQGGVVTFESYEPFGERVRDRIASEHYEQWYTGATQDRTTRLLYMNARDYQPVIGRFMSIDPVGFFEENPQSFNRYLYVNNNPYRYVDPDGEIAFIPLAIWAAGAAWTAYDTYTTYQQDGAREATKVLARDTAISAAGGVVARAGIRYFQRARQPTSAADSSAEGAVGSVVTSGGGRIFNIRGVGNLNLTPSGVDNFLATNAGRLQSKLGAKIGQGGLPFERGRAGLDEALSTVSRTLRNPTDVVGPFSTARGGNTVVDVFSRETGFTVRIRADGTFDTLIPGATSWIRP